VRLQLLIADRFFASSSIPRKPRPSAGQRNAASHGTMMGVTKTTPRSGAAEPFQLPTRLIGGVGKHGPGFLGKAVSFSRKTAKIITRKCWCCPRWLPAVRGCNRWNQCIQRWDIWRSDNGQGHAKDQEFTDGESRGYASVARMQTEKKTNKKLQQQKNNKKIPKKKKNKTQKNKQHNKTKPNKKTTTKKQTQTKS